MTGARAFLYIVAVILLVLAAPPWPARGYLIPLAGASALLALALPDIAAAVH